MVDAAAVNLAELEQALAAREPLILHSVAGTKTDLREPYPVRFVAAKRVFRLRSFVAPPTQQRITDICWPQFLSLYVL